MPEVRMKCIHCFTGGVARLCLIGLRSYGDQFAMMVWQSLAAGAVDVMQVVMTLRWNLFVAETRPVP
jgi:hypothetical protein